MKDQPLRVCLLGASLNTGNMGVSALASGTIASVLNSHPDARVFLLDYGREPGRYTVQSRNGPATVDLVNIRFSKKFYLRNNIAWLLFMTFLASFLPSKWKNSWLAKNPYLKSILESDIVASIAGGDSFSDIYGLGRLLYVALPQILALRLNKPLILLPQTLGPFKGRIAQAIARHIMRRALVVYSRDQSSFDEAKRLLGRYQHKLKFSHDMAFVLKAVAPVASKLATLPSTGNGTPLIGINVSGLLLMGGYTRDNMFGLKTNYAQLVREMVDHFVQEHKANVLLIPHVFGQDSESDTQACAEIFRELQSRCNGRLHLLQGDFNQHEIKYVIGQCDFFLGSRMHACIAALSQAVPGVCLAYSRKFAGVMETIGAEELVADMCSLDNEATLKTIRQIFNSRASIHERLQTRMPEVRESVYRLFSPENLGRTAVALKCDERTNERKAASVA